MKKEVLYSSTERPSIEFVLGETNVAEQLGVIKEFERRVQHMDKFNAVHKSLETTINLGLNTKAVDSVEPEDILKNYQEASAIFSFIRCSPLGTTLSLYGLDGEQVHVRVASTEDYVVSQVGRENHQQEPRQFLIIDTHESFNNAVAVELTHNLEEDTVTYTTSIVKDLFYDSFSNIGVNSITYHLDDVLCSDAPVWVNNGILSNVTFEDLSKLRIKPTKEWA